MPGVVLSTLLVALGVSRGVVSATGRREAASLPLAVVELARVAVGGAVIGFGLGWLASEIIDRVDGYLIETTVTTIVAFGWCLVAERLHVSGVLAVVAAGLLVGNVGPRGMSPTTRIVLLNLGEHLAFVANSLVFLPLGMQVNLPDPVENSGRTKRGIHPSAGRRLRIPRFALSAEFRAGSC